MAKVKIKKFDDVQQQLKWLADNQAVLKAQRRSEPKKTDAHSYGMTSFAINDSGDRLKTEDVLQGDAPKNVLKVRVVINATNILDSHRDLHIPGIWKKSLSQKTLLYLCREHQLTFEGIISDEVKAYTQTMTFKDLGFNYEGNAECLIFDAVIHKERNPYMFDQYAKGYVRNHSVRMQYVKEYFCMDSDMPDHAQFKDNWEKYSAMIANKECMTNINWFYAVIEAKIVDEGSAVVKGSCGVSPTLEVEENKTEPPVSIQENEPPVSTQKENPTVSEQWDTFLKRKN